MNPYSNTFQSTQPNRLVSYRFFNNRGWRRYSSPREFARIAPFSHDFNSLETRLRLNTDLDREVSPRVLNTPRARTNPNPMEFTFRAPFSSDFNRLATRLRLNSNLDIDVPPSSLDNGRERRNPYSGDFTFRAPFPQDSNSFEIGPAINPLLDRNFSPSVLDAGRERQNPYPGGPQDFDILEFRPRVSSFLDRHASPSGLGNSRERQNPYRRDFLDSENRPIVNTVLDRHVPPPSFDDDRARPSPYLGDPFDFNILEMRSRTDTILDRQTPPPDLDTARERYSAYLRMPTIRDPSPPIASTVEVPQEFENLPPLRRYGEWTGNHSGSGVLPQFEAETTNGFSELEEFLFGQFLDFDQFQELEVELDHPREGPPEGVVDSLLATLPTIQVDTLKEEDQSCSICQTDYLTPGAAFSSDPSETEPAIQLRCLHVMGKTCIKKWLDDGNRTCPMCRADVYGTQNSGN